MTVMNVLNRYMGVVLGTRSRRDPNTCIPCYSIWMIISRKYMILLKEVFRVPQNRKQEI